MSVRLETYLDPAQVRALLNKRIFKPGTIPKALENAVRNQGTSIQKFIKDNTPFYTGTARDSVQRIVVGDAASQGVELVIFTQLPYWQEIESGRSPGAMPNTDAIEIWAQEKLNRPNLGYIIARKIQNKGIPGKFIWAKAAELLKIGGIQAIYDEIVKVIK